MRERLEFYLVFCLLKTLSLLPRAMAHAVSSLIARIGYWAAGRLRQTAYRNLQLALPHLSQSERHRIVCGVFKNLGRTMAEFSQFPKLNAKNVSDVVIYDGFENFEAAKRRGKGVLIVTAHFGAWELSSFAHAIYGHPMKFLVRPIDNPQVNALVMRYREMAGNEGINKRGSVREIMRALRANETVGILMDQNATREEGVFVDFLGIPACTTAGVATLALRTGAAVVPAVIIWDERLRKHRLRFEPVVPLDDSGNFEADVVRNTAKFSQSLEGKIRLYPDHWLWLHRRWKTRPPGEPSLYS